MPRATIPPFAHATISISCLDIRITGTVQGVGFRPFVYRVAHTHGITGTVCNSARGVEIRACGAERSLETFVRDLRASAPPLARIADLRAEPAACAVLPETFEIVESKHGGMPLVDITRDTATCADCLTEMRSPGDRRYRHAFINCTNCGPRFTIVNGLPYDRPATTMAPFPMCDRCRAEYADPSNRRFHAQPVCCHDCGPRLSLLDADGREIPERDPLAAAVEALAAGRIVAVKGLGGFHLACRADSDAALAALRGRKGREDKPFAIMTRDTAIASGYAAISPGERCLLESPERPIVVVAKGDGARSLARGVAPRVPTLGIMLPYTPVHHLLFDTSAYDTLVMTSANYSAEPICADNRAAVERLAGVAELFVVHDRAIAVRMDDSIVRVLDDAPVLMRRARGYVPSPLSVGVEADGIVGLGGILKSTVAVGRRQSCYVSHYLGVAETVPVIDNCERVLRHLLDVLEIVPRLFVADLHPGALTTRLVDPRLPLLRVQHHHAHAAACLAENGLDGPAVCLVYDGLGLGDDGTLWGGEVLLADRRTFTRVGHLAAMPMPGGDAATKYPGRMAIGALASLFGDRVSDVCPWIDKRERAAVLQLVHSGVHVPLTSSMGRLFDACAAALDVCRVQTYEGQPAIELEAAADTSVQDGYDVDIQDVDGRMILDGPRVLARVIEDVRNGTAVSIAAARFHNAIAAMSVEAAGRAAVRARVQTVCLSGGCFQNRLLFERTVAGLRAAGLTPVVHRILPPGDECVSFGHVVVAAASRDGAPPRPEAE